MKRVYILICLAFVAMIFLVLSNYFAQLDFLELIGNSWAKLGFVGSQVVYYLLNILSAVLRIIFLETLRSRYRVTMTLIIVVSEFCKFGWQQHWDCTILPKDFSFLIGELGIFRLFEQLFHHLCDMINKR